MSATKRRRRPDVTRHYLREARKALRRIRVVVDEWLRTGTMIDGPTIRSLVDAGLKR